MRMVQVSDQDINIKRKPESNLEDMEIIITYIYPNILIEVWEHQELILKKRKPSGYIYLPGSKFCQA